MAIDVEIRRLAVKAVQSGISKAAASRHYGIKDRDAITLWMSNPDKYLVSDAERLAELGGPKRTQSLANPLTQSPLMAETGAGPSGHLSGQKSPKILHFDIETLPNEGYFFDIYSDRGIALQFVRRAKAICCLSYKWHGDDKVVVIMSESPYNDANVCSEFLPVYEQADYVCGHYAGGFDIPFIDGRMFANGLKPLPDKNVLDTYKIAKKKFGKTLNSNRLDHLAELLGVGRKNKTDAQLWVDCAQGKPEALQEMAAYNAQDVKLLEDVFTALRPWFSKKINANLFIDDATNRCRSCESENLSLIGYELTAATMKPQYRCGDCGAVSSFKQVKK